MESTDYINLVLSVEIQNTLISNSQQDVYQFLLKNHSNTNVAILAEQLEGRQKAKQKLPTWYNNQNIVFPARISMEQCSSELTAIFKSNLVSGNSLIDLTGGFGVDDWAFSKQFSSVTYLDQQSHLSQLVAHNFKELGVNNVTVKNQDGIEYLKTTNETFDCIYLDPARRKESQKVFKLSDCEPNIEEIQNLLWSKTNVILLKCSPLLDIDLATKSLQYLKKVIVVAVENECKELLFLLDKNWENDFEILTVNLKSNGDQEIFEFHKNNELETSVVYQNPAEYIYEPNASILKSGGFKSIASKFGLDKLHPNSHLYTSSKLITDFPGRKFIIKQIYPFSKNKIKKLQLPNKANISTRNFPYSTEELRKLTKIKDGGSVFLFFTTLIDSSLSILECEKVI